MNLSRVTRIALAMISALLGTPGGTHSRPEEDWVGRRALTRFGTILQVGEQVVDDERLGVSPRGRKRRLVRIYRVEKALGPWLRLRAETCGVRGWVRSGQIIPLDLAIDVYTEEIHAHPDDPAIYLDRAAAWAALDEHDRAIADCDEAIRLDPDNEVAFVCRGTFGEANGDFDRALDDFDRAIGLDPNYALAHRSRGRAAAMKGDLDRALADLSEAIRLDPADAEALAYRGLVRAGGRDFDRALADCDEAIRLAPRSALAYTVRASAWVGKAAFDRALADYDEAASLDPDAPAIFHEQARLLATCPDPAFRDGPRAVESATRACELTAWSDPGPLATLADGYAEAGDLEAAAGWREKSRGLIAGASARPKVRGPDRQGMEV